MRMNVKFQDGKFMKNLVLYPKSGVCLHKRKTFQFLKSCYVVSQAQCILFCTENIGLYLINM